MKRDLRIWVSSALAVSLLAIAPGPQNQAAAGAGPEQSMKSGKLCLKQGKYQQAAKDFECAAAADPSSCEAQFLLGQAYCKLKQYNKAKASLRKAIRVGKGSVNAQKANLALMTLPKQYQSPKTGPETRMIASMLGLGRQRGGAAKPTVIDFYADWCNPCKQLNVVMNKYKSQYGDKVTFMHVDVDDPNNEKLLDQYEVSPIPTLVFLNPEGEVVTFSVGFSGETAVNDNFKKILTDS